MTFYAGLDVSTRETAICVIDPAGLVVWEGKIPTRVEAIAATLAVKAPGLVHVGMETGPVSVWLWHGLREVGVAVDCIHARRAAAAR
jgi:transposase